MNLSLHARSGDHEIRRVKGIAECIAGDLSPENSASLK